MTKLYGASDDLIELDGDFEEELNAYDAGEIKFSASDETDGTIKYDDDGNWKIHIIRIGSLAKAIIPAVGEDNKHIGDAEGCTPYSDVLIFKEGLEWIKIGRKKIKAQ